jgi:hypothetical protein
MTAIRKQRYQLIFALPSIRDLKVATDLFTRSTSFSIPMAEQSTTLIESLDVDHSCTVHALLALLSYTPRLHRLKCGLISAAAVPTPKENMNVILTLTHISIKAWSAGFDQLETFLTNIAPTLQSLSIGHCDSEEFLNAERCERVITQHFPHLWKLNWTYAEVIDQDFVVARHHEYINRFMSPFWIKKHWLFKVAPGIDSWSMPNISYVISTYKYVSKHHFRGDRRLP